jgi:hypothetical protein
MTKVVAKKTTLPAPVPKMDVLTALQKLDADQARLTEARAKLLAGAKAELLTAGQQLITKLGALGFRYQLTAVSPAKAKSPKQGASKAVN